MPEYENQPCPPAISSFIRSRLNTTSGNQTLSEFIKWFFSPIPSETVGKTADVRQFSNCNIDLMTCFGSLIGYWSISSNAEISYDPVIESNRMGRRNYGNGGNDGSESSNAKLLRMRVFNFAFSKDMDKCVINEISIDGVLTQSLYEYTVHGEILGSQIGKSVIHKYVRDDYDTCFPENWPPTGKEGHAPLDEKMG